MRFAARACSALLDLRVVWLPWLAHKSRIYVFVARLQSGYCKGLARITILTRALVTLISLLWGDRAPLQAALVHVVALSRRSAMLGCDRGREREREAAARLTLLSTKRTIQMVALITQGARDLVAVGFPALRRAAPRGAAICEEEGRQGSRVRWGAGLASPSRRADLRSQRRGAAGRVARRP